MGSRAKKHQLPPEEYDELKKKVLYRDGHRCRNPHCTPDGHRRRDNLQVHHIIKRSQQGPDTSWNLVTLCNVCHDLVESRDRLILLVIEPKGTSKQANADEGLRFVRKEKSV